MLSRRSSLLAIASPLALLAAPAIVRAKSSLVVDVWKDPNCGCCGQWIEHMQKSGFTFKVHETGNARARAKFGIPQELGSCHTAMVDGYALEGHVPAQDVLRLLKEKPDALGLVVPGMPMGSPGMEGGRSDRYQVLLLSEGSPVKTSVFATYG